MLVFPVPKMFDLSHSNCCCYSVMFFYEVNVDKHVISYMNMLHVLDKHS